MMTLSDADLKVLDPSNNKGYGPKPLPSVRDEEISRIIARVAIPDDFTALVRVLDSRHDTVLLAFAERMASLAVRRQSPEDIRIGLVANALAVLVTKDLREALLILPLLFRSAEILGRNPVEDFASVARIVSKEAGEVLINFAHRRPEDRTIDVMGYVEGSDEDGFLFKRTW